ncbi:LCP family protein [Solwaraspora sp. WMMA2056]|uniref:LCP family protein n=1 Tax=Solwaraspora sp. WMMA2056 TaxID=3015161 RepID=UPI00259BCA1F|nr:LCP family protein [Solwaraspora sp. WMMA2056]WJK42163.1 LCP family protein [Solwaraspora sp. WMMA2056]
MTGRPDDRDQFPEYPQEPDQSQQQAWPADQTQWTADQSSWSAEQAQWSTDHAQWSGEQAQWSGEQAQWSGEQAQWSGDHAQWSGEHAVPDAPAPAGPAPEPVVTVSPTGGGAHRRPEPTRRPRRRLRRIALLGITGLVVTALAAAGAVTLVGHHYLGEIERIPDPFAAIPAEQRPAPTPEGMTFLFAGIDSQAPGATGADAADTPYGRTDSLMVVRITADHEQAYVVSIPRDAWVPIPGHDNFKINSAYALGGVSLAVQTVENATGLRIDHVAVIDLAGLRDLTDAVGGVTVDIPAGTPGLSLNASWPAGPQRLTGEQAVQYVRQRHGLPEGDFDRMRRHQNYLRALLTETLDRDTLTSPHQLSALLDAITGTVTVDDGLTNDKLRQLTFDLRKIRNDVRFVTAPVASTGFVGDQWVMWLDTERGVDFWSAVRNDDLDSYIDRYGADQLDTVVR